MLNDGFKFDIVNALSLGLEDVTRLGRELIRPVTLSRFSYVLQGFNLPDSNVVVLAARS